jgi:GntR family transcriptional regulator
MLIQRSSKLPLYQQIYEQLRENILSGSLKPGDMIPPESELLRQYSVSTVTIRQALEMLAQEGLIFRERGRGTFVAQPTLEQGLIRIVSFTEDMRNRGLVAGTKVLSADLIPAPNYIVEKLNIKPGEEMALVERLRLANGEPLSVEESYLIHRYCPGILKFDFATNSMREILEKDFGIRLVRAKQTIRAIAAPSNLAHLLTLPSNSPLLFIERVSYSQYDIPIEFLHIYYRGDRYSLHNELQG